MFYDAVPALQNHELPVPLQRHISQTVKPVNAFPSSRFVIFSTTQCCAAGGSASRNVMGDDPTGFCMLIRRHSFLRLRASAQACSM